MNFSIIILLLCHLIDATISEGVCSEVTHSECSDDDSANFLEATSPDRDGCRMICLGSGDLCHFFIFDEAPYGQGNCRLYSESFAQFEQHCKVMTGPRTQGSGCEYQYPEDNTCDVVRTGHCIYDGHVEETIVSGSWDMCQAHCSFVKNCNYWMFRDEEKECILLDSDARTCTWQFTPRYPPFEECNLPKTTVTPISTTEITKTTQIPMTTKTTTEGAITTEKPTTAKTSTLDPSCTYPIHEEHGSWHCRNPFSSSADIECSLECDLGYAPFGRSITRCSNGFWTTSPSKMVCSTALALVTGGSSGASQSVEVYSSDGTCNKPLPDLPEPRWWHTVDYVDGHIILCGGMGNNQPSSSCLQYDSARQAWIPHSNLNSQRHLHTSIVTRGHLTLLGGETSMTSSEYLVPNSNYPWAWTAGYRLVEDTYWACSTKVSEDSFIVTGGYENSNHVIQYNDTEGSSRRLQDMHYPRRTHGCSFVQNETFSGVLVAGGFKYAYTKTTELYNFRTGVWTEVGQLKDDATFGLTLVVLGERILAMGGRQYILYSSTVEEFDLSTLTWSHTTYLLQPRAVHAVTQVSAKAVGCL